MQPVTSRTAAPLPSTSREEPFHLDYMDGDDSDELVIPAENRGGAADLEERVQTTQHRLAQLRQEADELEQEKKRFEELSRQQKEFMQGRVEMGDKLTKALTHLDRETYEAQRRVEQLLSIKDTFNHHLDVIDSLNPEQWNPSDLRHDLTRALGMISEARDEYVKGSSRIHLLTGAGTPGQSAPSAQTAHHSNGSAPAGLTKGLNGSVSLPSSIPVQINRDTFRFWLFCGLGFTVPLAATAALLFLAWLIFR